jgi:hypothetical protein
MADEANTNKACHGRRKIYNHNEMHVHVYLLGMASAVIDENEQTAANKTYTVENYRQSTLIHTFAPDEDRMSWSVLFHTAKKLASKDDRYRSKQGETLLGKVSMMLVQHDRSKKDVVPLDSNTETLWDLLDHHESFAKKKKPTEAKEEGRTFINLSFAQRKEDDDLYYEEEGSDVVTTGFSSQDPEATELFI